MMIWHYTPYALPLFIGAALLLMAAVLGWERRATEGGTAVAGLSMLVLIYVLAYAFELGSQSIERTYLWLGIEYIGIVFSPVLMLHVALLLSGRRHHLSSLSILALLVPPVITLILAWTNPHHELIWQGLHIDLAGHFTRTLFDPGPWYWVNGAYLLVVYLGSAVLLVQTAFTSPILLRRQAVLSLLAILGPLTAYALNQTVLRDTGLDLVPYALTLSALFIVGALLRYRLVDILPVAHGAVLENIPDGIVALDDRDRIVDLNASAIRLLENEVGEDLIGQPAERVFSHWPDLLAALRQPGEVHARVQLRKADTLRQYDLTVKRLVNAQGHWLGRLIIVRDVTDQVALVHALQESEERWRSYIELANDLIFTLGPDGKFNSVNQAVIRLMGYSADELLGQSPLKFVAPDQAVAVMETLEAIFTTGDGPTQLDVVILTRDGQRRTLEIRGRLLKADDDVLGTFHIARDVTERRQADEELRQYRLHLEDLVAQRTKEFRKEKERAEAILHSTADAMVIMDREGKIELTNPAFEQLTGYPPEELVGRQGRMFAEVLQIPHQFISSMAASLPRDQHWRGDLPIRHASGRMLDLDAYVSHIAPVAGQGRGFVVALRDVTPFREVERAKDALLATAAHELRTPLTSLMGFSQILLTREFELPRRQHYLRLIYEQSVQLKAIIDDLLDVAKYEAGLGRDTDFEELDIIPLMRKTTMDIEAAYPARRFEFTSPDGVVQVRGYPLRLAQVLRNLLSNAIKYSEMDTPIRVVCDTHGDLVRISVEDQGIGISEEQQSRIFEKFYRADMSNNAAGGTGLGLTIAKLIVEMHGGRIDVDSQIGRGSVFTFTVPLISSHVDEAPDERVKVGD